MGIFDSCSARHRVWKTPRASRLSSRPGAFRFSFRFRRLPSSSERPNPLSTQARKDQFLEGKKLLEDAGVKDKIDTKLTARHANADDAEVAKKVDGLLAEYEKACAGFAKALASEEAPDADAPEASRAEGAPEKIYVLNKYERVEFADLLKAHEKRRDALKACAAALKAAKIPARATTTPIEEDAMTILSAKHMVGK